MHSNLKPSNVLIPSSETLYILALIKIYQSGWLLIVGILQGSLNLSYWRLVGDILYSCISGTIAEFFFFFFFFFQGLLFLHWCFWLSRERNRSRLKLSLRPLSIQRQASTHRWIDSSSSAAFYRNFRIALYVSCCLLKHVLPLEHASTTALWQYDLASPLAEWLSGG